MLTDGDERITMTGLREIAATIENLPNVLAMLLGPIDAATLKRRPSPDEWSVHEVVGHLITGDGPAFRDRIGSIVAGESHIAPFDPAVPMDGRDFNADELSDLLIELAEERSRSATMLCSLNDHDLAQTAMYGEDRRFEANDFVQEWPFHDHDHLQQILAVLKESHVSAMTGTMRRALDLD